LYVVVNNFALEVISVWITQKIIIIMQILIHEINGKRYFAFEEKQLMQK